MEADSLPYRYLDLPNNPLVADWMKYVENANAVFLHMDHGGTYLRPEIKDLFSNLGLIPKRGNLWSRPPFSVPMYHTDQKKDCELFAINWLLLGDPGITEWSFKALNHKIENFELRLNKETSPQLWGDPSLSADISAVLDKPMMIKTNIPHRVNTNNINTWRISYSLRFKTNPTWEYGLEQLKKYII